jgi:alpha-aminoadipate carrier protein LysW
VGFGGKIQMVNCPECDSVLDVEEEDLDEGDTLSCEECGSTLTVTSTSPIEIESADEDDEEEEEDEDSDDFDEDEDEEEEEEDEDWK